MRGRESAEQMNKPHKIAGMRITRIEPVLRSESEGTQQWADGNWRAADDLPELEPPEQPEERLRKSSRQIFSSDAISLTHSSAMEDVFEPSAREEHNDIVAKVTVYVLNAIVAVVSLPIGLALLAFNILGGVNLRTTAHVVALTGMGTALVQTPQGAMLTGLF